MKRAERRRARAWNEALAKAAKAIRREAGRMHLADWQRGRLLGAVGGLRFPTTALRGLTNAELARKWAISKRCVPYWRRQGCPFGEGRARVLEWMLGRRHLPPRCAERFGRELEATRERVVGGQIRALTTLGRVWMRARTTGDPLGAGQMAQNAVDRLAGEMGVVAEADPGGRGANH